MKFIFTPILILILTSCAHHPPLTEKGESVVLMKPENGKCKKIDNVLIFPLFGRKNTLNLENRFKNKVAELNGNVGHPIKIDTYNPLLEGVAYDCPKNYVQLHKKALYK